MSRLWQIIGCGYVGTRLARQLLSQGNLVCATRRSDAGCDEVRKAVPGAELSCFDLASPRALGAERDGQAPDVVVIASPPGPGSPTSEAEFARALGPDRRLLYISTTGVYAAGQGREVSDAYELAPASARGQARLDVEAAIREAHVNSVFLRVPGIYGPRRGVHERLRAGSYRLIGAADTLVARIHVDDLVAAIIVLGEAGELAHDEFIIADDCPTTAREHAMGVAQLMKLPEPPTVDAAEVSADIRAMHSADRRIVAKRLKSLGWRPRYSGWREGVLQALSEEQEE